MTVTLAYDSVLSRVRVTATALAAANVATVERSTNGIRWTTVRGASAVPVVAGALQTTVDDYEFPADVAVTYRVRGIETGAITFVAAGTGGTGNNASVTPGLPAGLVAGDLMLCLASIRNSGAGTVNVPAGWASELNAGNVRLMSKRYVVGDTAPTVTFTGGVANADTFGRTAAWRRAGAGALTTNSQLNASAVNVAYPGVSVTQDGAVAIVAAWLQDDWASVATLAGMTEIGESTSTAGDDASQAWDYVIQTVAANVAAGAFVPTGSVAAVSRGLVAVFGHAPYLNEQTAVITPTLDGIWLKSIARPFLNRRITVTDFSALTRPSRAGVFDIVGASDAIAVNDVRGSKRFSLEVMTSGQADESNLDLVLASGDPMLIHVGATCRVPGGYVTIGETSDARHTPRATRRFFDLPCTISAPPGPDVIGAALTWQTVLNTYPTWRALFAAHGTWANLLTLIGSPADVVVD